MTKQKTAPLSVRSRLIKAGLVLFSKQGFEQTTQTDICAHAGVTRGALYYHFPSGKIDLFEACALDCTQRLADGLAKGSETGPDLRDMLDTYLMLATDPATYRICIQEAPSVLGHTRWREIELQAFMPLLLKGTNSALEARLIYGTLLEATLVLAEHDFDDAAHARILDTLVSFLTPIIGATPNEP